MDYVFYLLRSLYRVKWWILLGTALITAFVYFRIGRMQGIHPLYRCRFGLWH